MSTLTIKDYADLMQCFDGGYINKHFEFIAHPRINVYFRLDDCNSLQDIQAKVLEWFSRPAYKAQPYSSKGKNDVFNARILCGINQYLGTSFDKVDIATIYQELGNCVNHKLTVDFIESGYDMNVLKEN